MFMFVFQKCFNLLNPNGLLILEPQPFKSYSRRCKINDEMKMNYKNITFNPCQFKTYLMDVLDFKLIKELHIPPSSPFSQSTDSSSTTTNTSINSSNNNNSQIKTEFQSRKIYVFQKPK